MVKEIVHNPIFLSQKSETATESDLKIAKDLLDTLIANQGSCVGLAANMIGKKKRIIVFENCGIYMTMFNPKIVKKSGVYQAEEGCLSLAGVRSTKRWQTIEVKYQNSDFEICQQTFTGWTAQIIQHEIDHCNGILI